MARVIGPIYRLGKDLIFPPPRLAPAHGLLAIGGDCRPERLVLAYSQGIFPWPCAQVPLGWFCPDPRCVLLLDQVKISRSLKKRLRKGDFEVRCDTAFAKVMQACAQVPRPGQDGTWITEDLKAGFMTLHHQGLAHSIEAYQQGKLVGGLYGLNLGAVFFGESMFSTVDDASKVAFATLVANLRSWNFAFVDCQVATEHLMRFGASSWPREEFLDRLHEALKRDSRQGVWHFDIQGEAVVDTLISQD